MSEKSVIVNHMIAYVIKKEREFQASKLSETQKHSEVVKNIISELEKEIANEDQTN